MALYISKDGQQLGPYSLAEAHTLVRGGKLVLTDWAWMEGLANWIPLQQIPGFATVPPPVSLSTTVSPVMTAPVVVEPLRREAKSVTQKIGGAVVAGGIALVKFKALLFGALKTGLSMILMIWFYGVTFGWKFAVGFVLLIFVHEMGHVVAAKWLGMPVTAPLFIPFVGAFITMKENPRDAWTEALMAYGGPFAGGLGSAACLIAGLIMGAPWVIAIASVSFIMNIFNMIPVPPLDGGRICSAISPWFWMMGVALLAAALFYFHSWTSVLVLGFIFVFATIPRIKETFFGQPSPEMQAYYHTHIFKRLLMALMYLGLLAGLVLGYWIASSQLADL